MSSLAIENFESSEVLRKQNELSGAGEQENKNLKARNAGHEEQFRLAGIDNSAPPAKRRRRVKRRPAFNDAKAEANLMNRNDSSSAAPEPEAITAGNRLVKTKGRRAEQLKLEQMPIIRSGNHSSADETKFHQRCCDTAMV